MVAREQTKKPGRVFLAEELGGSGNAVVVAPDEKKALELLRTYVGENNLAVMPCLVVIREIPLARSGVVIDKLKRVLPFRDSTLKKKKVGNGIARTVFL